MSLLSPVSRSTAAIDSVYGAMRLRSFMVRGISGDKAKVLRLRASDAADCARIHADADVYPQTLQLPYADEDMWRTRLGEMLAPGKTDLGAALTGSAPAQMAGRHVAAGIDAASRSAV